MALIPVYTLVEGFSGEVAGVVFDNGVAYVDAEAHPRAIAYFETAGYRFDAPTDEVPKGKQAEDEPSDSDIPGMPGPKATRAEVADIAESLGIDSESKTIQQLRELIKAELTKKA